MCLLMLGVFAASRVEAQPSPKPAPDIKVIGNFRATEPDGTMRVRCTVGVSRGPGGIHRSKKSTSRP